MSKRPQEVISVDDFDANYQRKKTRIDSDGNTETKELSLPELLDFTSAAAQVDIESRFGQIARTLLYNNRLSLVCGTKNIQYDFLEIEFYLRKSGHEDPFTHGAAEQNIAGQWYNLARFYKTYTHSSFLSQVFP